MRLTQTDSAFLYTESVSGPMHISSVVVVDGEIPFSEIFDHFDQRMHLVPSYRRKLAQVPFNVAHPTWVDDPDFSLSNHVIRIQIAPNSSLEEGFDEAIRLNETMLDRSRPLWAVYAIEGVAGKTLLLQATHHAMIDGASGVELMTIIYDFDAKGANVEPPTEPWSPAPVPHATDLFVTAMQENIDKLRATDWSSLLSSNDQNWDLLQRARRVISSFLTKPVITAPFNAGLVGPSRRLRWFKLSFADVREVRRALGGTINDVVLTIVSEAVARYLTDHGEATADQYMRIMCPVNVRTESKKGALGNEVSAIFPVLPAWPIAGVQRLATVVAEMDRIKSNSEAQALTLLQESVPEVWPVAMWPTQMVGTPLDPTAIAARLPTPVLPKGLRPPNVGINFVCTNVPGVQVPQYLCGREVTDQVGVLVLSGNLGFSLTIMSYNKQLYFGMISEPKLMPDVELVAEHAQCAFDELLQQARERAAAFGS